jgi:hypothetical protein
VAALIPRRETLARARVALYTRTRAAVLLDPAQGRWPAHEASDRLRLGAGLAASAAGRVPERHWEPFRAALVDLARAVAGTSGALPGDVVRLDGFGLDGGLAVVPWEGHGRVEVVLALCASSVGPVPVLERAGPRESPVPAVAALALLTALAVDADADGRLVLALAVEGIVGWYRESHRLTAPRNAVAYALTHASARLGETGRPLPAALREE